MRLYRFALGFADKVLFLNRDDEAFFRDHRLVAPAKVVNTAALSSRTMRKRSSGA